MSFRNTLYLKIEFKRIDGKGETQKVDYNDFFKVTQLTTFATSSSASNTSKHFVVTDYYGTDSQLRPTTLYAYVGLYSTSSTWQIGSKQAESFKFFVEVQTDLFSSYFWPNGQCLMVNVQTSTRSSLWRTL